VIYFNFMKDIFMYIYVYIYIYIYILPDTDHAGVEFVKCKFENKICNFYLTNII
jgi:hypothetical protein